MRGDTAITTTALAALLLTAAGGVRAEESELRCRLYTADGTESAESHESASAGVTLRMARLSGVCVFEDGSVADKQFIMTQHILDEGARGINHGYSVYTFADGDALTLAFEGAWDENGYRGEYEVLSGTGAWEGASGTGTLMSVESPWESTGVVDITIDVTTGES